MCLTMVPVITDLAIKVKFFSAQIVLVNDISSFDLFPVSSACGGLVAVHENKTITIQSPDYPWPYRKAKSCSWRVCPPQGMKLEFNFTTFDLRTFDKLEIING